LSRAGAVQPGLTNSISSPSIAPDKTFHFTFLHDRRFKRQARMRSFSAVAAPLGVQPSPDLLCVGHERPDGRALKKQEKKMKSIKHSFTRAATGNTGLSTFWLLVLILFLLDDADRREKKKRKKRERQAKLARKPPSGPKPF